MKQTLSGGKAPFYKKEQTDGRLSNGSESITMTG